MELWHSFNSTQVLNELQTTMDGLSFEEHKRRLLEYGPNRITSLKKQNHWILKFVFILFGKFQLFCFAFFVLCLSLCFVTSNIGFQTLCFSLIYFIILALIAMLNSKEECNLYVTLPLLNDLTREMISVIRNKIVMEVDIESLVPGDICNVKAGQQVPADLRVLSASDLKVNNESLTGESFDIKLSENPDSGSIYESKNIANCQCIFTSGKGVCVVFATGDRTFFGKINKSSGVTFTSKEPPICLIKEITHLVQIVIFSDFVLGLIFLILALLIGYSTFEAMVFLFISVITVVNISDDLFQKISIAWSYAAKNMQNKGLIPTNYDCIETLGVTSVICCDKTGTLTENRMTVSHVVYDKKIYITPNSPKMEGDTFELFDKSDPHFMALQRIAILASNAEFVSNHEDVLQRETKGDATESSLIKFFQPLRDINQYRKKCLRVFEVPFTAPKKWKFSINLQEESQSSKLIMVLKGAPEKLLSMCKSYYANGNVYEINKESLDEFESIYESLGKRGERIIAFAQCELEEKYDQKFPFEADPLNIPTDNLTFVGLISLIDPPRRGVKTGINECQSVGISVFMLTGDHPITATAIAKNLNLIPNEYEQIDSDMQIKEGKAIVVTGSNLPEWDNLFRHEQIVFARALPSQKQDFVRELIKKGHIVAMIGDGINDAPAVGAAHVGIAMGSSSPITKGKGQLILADENFGSIMEGIKEGRSLFNNIKKIIFYAFCSNVFEIFPFFLFIALKIPLNNENIVIILLDVANDLAPIVSLIYGKSVILSNIFLNRKENHLIGIRIIVITYIVIEILGDYGIYLDLNWAYNMLIPILLFQLINLLLKRTKFPRCVTKITLICFRTFYFTILIGLIIIVFFYIPGIHTMNAANRIWIMCCLLSLDEIRKIICILK